jgi:sarcosine oxidase subunit alpha
MKEPVASAPPPHEHTPTGQPLALHFDGRTIFARPGQSIAAALYAFGIRTFTRSFKYHRPRGLFCVAGDCPNCLMQVDGRPNVRTCVEPAREGQVVRSQHAWPSLDWDVFRIFDAMHRILPVGFYYKRFHRPRFLWPIFERVVRHLAGLGQVDLLQTPDVEVEVENLHTQVCIVGSGPAGMSAALTAAEARANVMLVDREPYLGGHLRFSGGLDAEAMQAERSLRQQPLVQLLCNTTAFGLFEGNLLAACQANRLLKIRAGQIIVCTGGRQQPFLFHNNDLPGIMLGQGVLRLARVHGVTVGRRAVVLTDNDHGHFLAGQLQRLGIEVAAVVDHRSSVSEAATNAAWPTLASSVIQRADGRSHLRGVWVVRSETGSVLDPHSEQFIACDLLCLAGRLVPANELLLQGGTRCRYEGGRWVPERQVPGLWGAGAAAGTFDLDAQRREGRLRGAEASAALGLAPARLDEYRGDWNARAAVGSYELPSMVTFPSKAQDPKRFVCLCEDVTEKDVQQAIAEGFDGIETLKRYSTVNMGPCQGKVCGQTAVELCAHMTGCSVGSVGTTTSRPPAQPVELAVLAAGQHHHPVRRTPLHHWHAQAGARWLDAGLWKRPEAYDDPAAEVLGVRQTAGLIDVSTLGKIELVGPDAAELLERTYLNHWADLKPGRVRYGAMCNEDGILFDDGVGARLAADRFYLTATTGNAEAVVQWLQLWQASWRLDAAILNQTSAWAAVNLAGPQSRQILGKLVEIDLAPDAFPYLAIREGRIAGVPCRVLRIGFVGELGYEIHCPSACALYVWEAIVAAGREHEIRPFGVEAQRILRLEKGHLIIGQDTDALSNPLEAGLEWLVRFEKPRFLGREPLLQFRARGLRSKLVGFVMADSDRVVPEGSQVVEQGRPVGRLTSTRYSPTMKRSIGLAWLPVQKVSIGERFLIRCNGADVPALVARVPFFDPDGKRLKN